MANNLFRRNIDGAVRIVRGMLAAVLLMSGGLLVERQLWLGAVLLAAGLFVLFEALRGWCAFRACGIKTRL